MAARNAGVSEVTFAGAVVEAVEVPLLVSVEERAAQLAVSKSSGVEGGRGRTLLRRRRHRA